MVLFGGLSGGVSSHLAGGSFAQGFTQGIITAGLNHALHAGADAWREGRSVRITITDRIATDEAGNPKWAYVYGYPRTDPIEFYEVPVYEVTVEGTDSEGNAVSETFEALRYGVSTKSRARTVTDFLTLDSHTESDYPITASTMSAFKNSEIPMLRVGSNGSYFLHPYPKLSSNIASGLIGCVGFPNYTTFYNKIVTLHGTGPLILGKQYSNINVNYQRANVPSLIKINLKTR